MRVRGRTDALDALQNLHRGSSPLWFDEPDAEIFLSQAVAGLVRGDWDATFGLHGMQQPFRARTVLERV
jgi:hypothetical protein